MRTPGDDDDLVVGLLYGEGVISGIGDVEAVGPSDEPGLAPDLARNVRVATLAPGAAASVPRRATVMGSACGVCGRTSIADVIALSAAARARAAAPAVSAGADLTIPAALLTGLPAVLRERQSVFASTGGLHAAGFFEADGTLAVAREDVGRHNATDKAVGALLRERRADAADPPRLGEARLRDRPEGGARGREDRRGRLGADEPRRRARGGSGTHGRRVPARRALQRLRAPRAHRSLSEETSAADLPRLPRGESAPGRVDFPRDAGAPRRPPLPGPGPAAGGEGLPVLARDDRGRARRHARPPESRRQAREVPALHERHAHDVRGGRRELGRDRDRRTRRDRRPRRRRASRPLRRRRRSPASRSRPPFATRKPPSSRTRRSPGR